MKRVIFPFIAAGIGILASIVLNITWISRCITDDNILNILRVISTFAAVIPSLYALYRAEERYQISESERKKSEAERQKKEALQNIRDLLRTAIRHLFPDEDTDSIRANIMLVVGERLEILCSVNMEFSGDIDASFGYGEGCAGTAWKRAMEGQISESWRPILAPDAHVSAKKLREEWHLTEDLIQKTRDVYWVMSIPIFYRSHQETSFVGILSFDGYNKYLRNRRRLNNVDLHMICASIAEHIGKELVTSNLIG